MKSLKYLLTVLCFSFLFVANSVQAQTSPLVYIDHPQFDGATLSVRFYNQNSSDKTILVDLELYGPDGSRVAQEFFDNVNLTPSGSKTFTLTVPTNLSPGDYRLAVGEFAPGWTDLYFWWNSAKVVTIGNNPPPNFTVEGYNQTSARITNTASSDGYVLVDLELYDRENRQVAQRFFDHEFIRAGETKSYSLGPVLLSPGTHNPHVLKVGIFKPAWTSLISWHDKVSTFTVGS